MGQNNWRYDVDASADCYALEDIPQGAIVKQVAGGREVYDGTGTPYGIAVYAAEKGQRVDVAIRGTIDVLVGAAITAAGDTVYAGSDGRTAASGDWAIGQATDARLSTQTGSTVTVNLNIRELQANP